ncbi:hypothetical protein COO60DRAFT_1551694 [Scenedesmus sp. NREL 46B-D3]|nr:hypothetical protein COO60DRAFT_1551694 [Scenedesmus sp. NREL 46B-D3]
MVRNLPSLLLCRLTLVAQTAAPGTHQCTACSPVHVYVFAEGLLFTPAILLVPPSALLSVDVYPQNCSGGNYACRRLTRLNAQQRRWRQSRSRGQTHG